ncbi:uncharacterized protein DUF1569 [Mucilaginibacter frigoritolerans]|uniref:Uncharacterized protein DUF1569 n=1 Tax=Mucilaginibacter frigoritolerans TaxID=652788 RepID=A0A562UD76_9SPHI|nr:DinB family protein [Mucilaginibacter frigoritolerans]TWJ03357.1 uncharacterized protein DUF1569 [Mucilaginibacter frigoritolerans]
MKSIFNKADRAEVLDRIDALTENNKPAWGKMSVEQMVKHCSLCEEYYQGKFAVKRAFLGRLIGKMALASTLNKSVLQKNAPTVSAFLVTEAVNDLASQKRNWKALIESYSHYPHEYFPHWFFGKMTKDQLGQFVYIHCNHHLSQFGV